LPSGQRGARRRGRGDAGGAEPVGARRDKQERGRPERGDIDPAALRLIARPGAEILATARRYAASPEDAEDAYQRGPEILLRKAPTTPEEELVPWLKTVVIRTIRPLPPTLGCELRSPRLNARLLWGSSEMGLHQSVRAPGSFWLSGEGVG
jgi:Sigma-70 region 2